MTIKGQKYCKLYCKGQMKLTVKGKKLIVKG